MQLFKILVGTTSLLALVGCDQWRGGPKKKEMESVVKAVLTDLLDKEPDLVFNAVEKALQKQRRELTQKLEAAATESQQKMWATKLIAGNKDAKLRLSVFFDPLNPACQKFYTAVIEPLVKERSDVGFFMIPISVYEGEEAKAGQQFVQESVTAARGLISAAWQAPDKALSLLSKMPSFREEMPRSRFVRLAKEAGLSPEKISEDIDSDASAKELRENAQLALAVNIPIDQLPVIFVKTSDGKLSALPPFTKENLIIVLDAVKNDKPWDVALNAALQERVSKAGATPAG